MTMALLPNDGIEIFDLSENQSFDSSSLWLSDRYRANTRLIDAKLRRPTVARGLVQERLLALLERSVQNHSGTLIVGRAGSGKTSLAANFAGRERNTAWLTLDAGDAEWASFARYFRAAVLQKTTGYAEGGSDKIPEARTPLELFSDLTAALELQSKKWPTLLVLDGVHRLFDTEWFGEFFEMMIASLLPPAHVLLLSRSKPPNPLWRLRSKQVLNVIDEKLLAFSAAESEELFARHGLSRREALAAHRESYGRAGKLIRFLESKGQS